jgi:hypothetical protein
LFSDAFFDYFYSAAAPSIKALGGKGGKSNQVEMIKTREIRWFFESPQGLLTSFFEGLPRQAASYEERTDRYLAGLLSEGNGVKLRGGRLEIKSRVDGPETGVIAPGLEGVMETWVKYGFELKEGAQEGVADEDIAAQWLDVAKERWVTLVDATGPNLQFHPLGYQPGDYVQVEYTRISLGGRQWYTFGLEWLAGGPAGIPESFFVGVFKGTRLQKAQSMGYPAFLKRVAS